MHIRRGYEDGPEVFKVAVDLILYGLLTVTNDIRSYQTDITYSECSTTFSTQGTTVLHNRLYLGWVLIDYEIKVRKNYFWLYSLPAS